MIGTHKKNVYEILGRDPVHPFPARMAPGIALEVISSEKRPVRILDPMSGSGTVLAVARANGHHAIGIDIDPLAILISKVWTAAVDPERVRQVAREVLIKAKNDMKVLSSHNAYPRGADQETKDFIDYWFDTHNRKQLTALSTRIRNIRTTSVRNVLWCSFSKLIIAKKTGASLAMDLSHSRPHKVFTKAPIQPFEKWLATVEKVLENCISKTDPKRGPVPRIQVGDARSLPLRAQSIDLVLTSPPYLNAIDYIRCSKFSLVWMGFPTGTLRHIRGHSVGSEVLNSFEESSLEVQKIICDLKLQHKLSRRNLGILTKYIADMYESIKEISRVLAPGGKAVYVVGENTLCNVYIRNSKIVVSLAGLCGLQLVERRTRCLPANRRYLPPPSKGKNIALNARMRREVVLAFRTSN